MIWQLLRGGTESKVRLRRSIEKVGDCSPTFAFPCLSGYDDAAAEEAAAEAATMAVISAVMMAVMIAPVIAVTVTVVGRLAESL